jgi:mRNA interferase MazF
VETFTKGDIVLFPFPYTDLTNRKIRPCLVLSSEMNEDVLLCQITSTKSPKDLFSVLLKQNELIDGTLSVDSLIRSNMLFTANKSQIVRKICSIKKDKYLKVVSKIVSLISVD